MSKVPIALIVFIPFFWKY